MEFGGFIGGVGKIFFTKGGINREKEGFGEMEGRSYIFLKFFEEYKMNLEFCGEMYFWGFWGGERNFWVEEEKGCNMEYSLMECFL